MQLIFLLWVLLLTWHSHLNCHPLTEEAQTEEPQPEEAQTEQNPINVWANDVKKMINKLVDDDLNKEKLKERLDAIKEKATEKMPLPDEKLWKERAQELLMELNPKNRLYENKYFVVNARELFWKVGDKNGLFWKRKAEELCSEELISEDEEFKEKMQRRLKFTLSNYYQYIRCHEFKDNEKKSFLKSFKTVFEKEFGTFLIEYEFLLIEKEVLEKDLALLRERFTRIWELLQENPTYYDIGFFEKAKMEIYENIRIRKLTGNKAIRKLIESVKRNTFENECKLKIDAFEKSPYVYSGSYLALVRYIQEHWPKMDNMKWDNTLGETLEKIKQKK